MEEAILNVLLRIIKYPRGSLNFITAVFFKSLVHRFLLHVFTRKPFVDLFVQLAKWCEALVNLKKKEM